MPLAPIPPDRPGSYTVIKTEAFDMSVNSAHTQTYVSCRDNFLNQVPCHFDKDGNLYFVFDHQQDWRSYFVIRQSLQTLATEQKVEWLGRFEGEHKIIVDRAIAGEFDNAPAKEIQGDGLTRAEILRKRAAKQDLQPQERHSPNQPPKLDMPKVK